MSALILTYSNTRKETILQMDASIKELGACLLQQGKPVYFTSKTLTEAQKGDIAIESLAVVWAMEKFHHFLYGNHFTLKTDQKPLGAILSESLNQSTPHLQRILVRTLPYHFTVHHILGPNNHLADCLSRLGTQNDSIHQATKITSLSNNQSAKHNK